MKTEAKSVQTYLNELPEDRKPVIEEVRDVILKNLPDGFEEVMNWGMITYQVPLSVYPDTYNKKPLMYAALASQKNHMSLYLTGIYVNEKRREEFEVAYKATGKRYDVGKSCVRFRKIEDLPLNLIGSVISSFELDDFVTEVKQARKGSGKKK